MRRLALAATLLAAVFGGLLVAVTLTGASAATMSTAAARSEVARLVASTYPDLRVGNVACPPTAARATGTTFTCTVQIPGSFLLVDARQDGRTGEVALTTPDAVLTKAALEQFVASNASLRALVDCGPAPAVVRRPGQNVTCTATLEDGTRRNVTLNVRDTAGTVAIASVT